MLRALAAVLTASLVAAAPLIPPVPLPSGDATIRGRAGLSDIVVTTTSRLAGAVHSLTWDGVEFIDSVDHGRQLQSACSFDCGGPGRFWAETFNPTEAGSRRDGAGARSSSLLLSLRADGSRLDTTTRMAYWLAPGEASPEATAAGRVEHPAKNCTVLSNHVLRKSIAIGLPGFPHAIDYRVTFTVPPGDPPHTLAQFESLTGYMPSRFSVFRTLDPATGVLAPLSDGPGEQRLPVVFSTPDGRHAMGAWSPGPNPGYGRFRFPPPDDVVKWNVVFRVRDKTGVKPGDYTYRVVVAVGTLEDVRRTLTGVAARTPAAGPGVP